jgi:hypothetical protein
MSLSYLEDFKQPFWKTQPQVSPLPTTLHSTSIKQFFTNLNLIQSKMSGIWQQPDQNSYEEFLKKSSGPTNKNNQKTPADRPMPEPKNKSAFGAWGGYTGAGEDQEFVKWKKEQVAIAEKQQGLSAGSAQQQQSNNSGTTNTNNTR